MPPRVVPLVGSGTGPEHATVWGHRAETLVAERLSSDGWTVLARNWRAAGGELDLVVERDGVLRFVEVKARTADEADALDAIGSTKQRRLRAAGNAWLGQRGEPVREVAFLVAVVTLDAGRPDEAWSITWWDDAF